MKDSTATIGFLLLWLLSLLLGVAFLGVIIWAIITLVNWLVTLG